jgi:hypothetical protein
MIDYERKVVFVHVPRTGGTSIEEAFGLREESKQIHHWKASELLHLADDDYYWFSFVRNPWDKTISSYFQPANKKIGWLSGKTLDYFFDNWKGSSAPCEHSETQLGYLDIPNIDVFKYENRDEHVSFLETKFNTPIKNIHIRKTKRDRDYRKYYNNKTKEIVRNLFIADIEMFNYDY